MRAGSENTATGMRGCGHAEDDGENVYIELHLRDKNVDNSQEDAPDDDHGLLVPAPVDHEAGSGAEEDRPHHEKAREEPGSRGALSAGEEIVRPEGEE